MSTRLRVVQVWITWAWICIYIYIFFFICLFIYLKVQVVIWETLREKHYVLVIVPLNRFVCLFFFNQDTAFYTVGARHSHDMCLTACFVYDKRAWVIHCSLGWHWYFFETSDLAHKIYFIMFSGRKCETTLTYGAYNKTLEVILRDTYVLHMLFNISCNRPCRSLS